MNSTSPTPSQARERAHALLVALTDGLHERDTAVRLALLTTIAGESLFLLGPPGVGKSLVARRLKHAFVDGRHFEYLMNRFSTPDEIFGPVSIRRLKDDDRYERLTERYLPGANVVFLDEIWKAGAAIQNALLTVLNEKVYRNGEQEVVVALRGLLTASNELPPAVEGHAPLWDRLLVRLELGGIRDPKRFLDMITDTRDVYDDPVPEAVKLSVDEIDAWSEAIDRVVVPPEVLTTVQVVRHRLDEVAERGDVPGGKLEIWDRRWKKVVRLMRTSAFLCGRDQVDLMDCFLMVHCLWNHPDQRALVQEAVAGAIREHGYSVALDLSAVRRELSQFEEEVEAEVVVEHVLAEDRLAPVQEEYYAFERQEAQFEGRLLRIRDYQALRQDEYTVINLYDERLNVRHRLKAKRSLREHAIELFYNSQEHTVPLTTHKVERTERIRRKPHALVAEHFATRHAQLSDYLAGCRQRLGDDAPEALDRLDDHLFVDVRLARIVRANLEEVRRAVGELELRLDKVKHAWEAL